MSYLILNLICQFLFNDPGVFPYGNLVFLPPQKPSFQIPVQLWKGTEMNECIIASFQNISFTFIFLTYHLQVSPVPSRHTQAAPTIHLQN